ncbi:hypothetical protein DRQ25_03910 [Candidatus Fermentibacteria bacterium]|nr:MAG: hypothetical protein DRQ25_03910 [Candidatus Fermentibacteria bacterium]
MKHAMLISLCLLIVCPLFSEDVNGSIEYTGDIRILNLWGTWPEMGYAHGYLLGPDIAEVFHEYFLEMVGGVSNYANLRAYFLMYFDLPPVFIDYSQGILSGISDTVSIYSVPLGRNMDYIDICVVSSIPDLSALGGMEQLLCTSVSAWNAATEGEPELSGAPAVSRNLDYYVDTGGSALDNSILMTFDPESGQDWVSVGFPGFAGSLSGMNESGISASLNMGNNPGTVQFTSPFIPICMALALGLGDEDFNGSGQCDVEDMKDALTEWNRCNSYDIHIVADRNLAGQDSSSVVVEVNNRNGYAFRYSGDEPDIAPCRMILSNHHRVLIPPVGCYRYALLIDSLTLNPDVTLERLWNFMGAVGWPATPGSGGTIQTMVFMPEHLRMGLAFATAATPSYEQVPEWIEWTDIFPNHPPQSIEGDINAEQLIRISPNPSSGIVSISYQGSIHDISLYDTAGRKLDADIFESAESCLSVDLSALPEGIYRILVQIENTVFAENVVIIR